VSDQDETKRPTDEPPEPTAKPEAKPTAKPEAKPDDASTTAAPPPSTALATTTGDADDKERMDLPKWNRARVKRKQVRGEEEDAFQGSVRKAGRQALRSAPAVLAGVVLVAGIIAGALVYVDHREQQAATATNLLASAVGWRARGEIADVEALMKDRKREFPIPLANDEAELREHVQQALSALAEEAPESNAARLAGLVRGAKAMEEGRFGDAQTEYEAFLETADADHELRFLAHEGVVLALEAQEKLDEALAAVDPLLGEPGAFYRDQTLWQRARLLEQLERGDEALEVYKQYVAEYPLDQGSLARHLVTERLRELAPDMVPAASPPPGGLAGGLPGAGLQGLGQ
jgi:predicted negative regulator of RcsB-dependent stress response